MATHNPINILEAFAAAPPPLDYVLPNMVAGTVGALVSPGGAGKSMLALQLAAQIAGGPDLLGVGELPTGPVIYLPAEDPPTAIHHRLHALGAHLSAEERQAVADGLLIQPLIGSLPNIMASNWFEALKRAAEGRRLMILDTLRRFHIEEENASGPMAQVIGRMEAIAADTGCSIVFLHHASKGAVAALCPGFSEPFPFLPTSCLFLSRADQLQNRTVALYANKYGPRWFVNTMFC